MNQPPVKPTFTRAPRPANAVSTAHPSATGATTVRLNKRMAELGMCSRREADAWIEQGWVLVNGKVAEMGMQVESADRITIERAAQAHQEQQVTVLLHKPMGYVSGQAEDGHTPAIHLIEAQNRWRDDRSPTRFVPRQRMGLAPAGRLDIDSVGLLVLTQDGRVARQLIGEDSLMEKEYLVRVVYTGHANSAAANSAAATYGGKPTQLSRIDDDDPISADVQSVFPPEKLQLLRHGLSLDGKPLRPAQVSWQNC